MVEGDPPLPARTPPHAPQPNATAADVLSWPVLGGMAALASAVLVLALLLARYQHQLGLGAGGGGGRSAGGSGAALLDKALSRGAAGVSPPRSAGPASTGGSGAAPPGSSASSSSPLQAPGLKAAHGKGSAAFLGPGGDGHADAAVHAGGGSL